MSVNEKIKFTMNIENVATTGALFAVKQHEFFELPEFNIDLKGLPKKERQFLINQYANGTAGLIALLLAIAEEGITLPELKTILIKYGYYGNSSLN